MAWYDTRVVNFIAPRARHWLRDGRPARVLHIFEGVCNLVNDRGEVLSVVAPRIGPGPLGLVLAGEAASALEQREPVYFDNAASRLTVGGLLVEWQRATLWSPWPDWEQMRRASGWPLPGQLPPDIDVPLRRTVAALVAGDGAACQAGARGLAGRGAGLTPAGDDVLVGILHALWVWGWPSAWAIRLATEAAPHTTTLSANLLYAAAEGEASWLWHDVVRGRPGAVAALLAVGHTSGADAWAGFVAAYDALRVVSPQTAPGVAG